MKIENLKLKISVSGFTLIELLIVIAIIGILSAMLLTNFVGIRQRARDSQRKSDLRQIQSALELYRTDIGGYPSSITFGGSLSNPNGGTTYMTKIPYDPLNTGQYIYRYNSTGTTYSLIVCLENSNDSQKDPSDNSVCTGGTTNWSYTLTNP